MDQLDLNDGMLSFTSTLKHFSCLGILTIQVLYTDRDRGIENDFRGGRKTKYLVLLIGRVPGR